MIFPAVCRKFHFLSEGDKSMRRSVRFYVCWAISMIALASIAPRIQAAPQPDPPSIPAVRDQMNKFVEMKEIAGPRALTGLPVRARINKPFHAVPVSAR